MKASTVASLLFFAATATAHATWQQLWVNGVDAGSSCNRKVASNNPVTSATSSDMACNVHTNAQYLCHVKPGDKVTVEMHQQPNDRSCASEAIGGDHHGPVTIYMASVSDAKTAVATSANWFKIHETGLIGSNPKWWADDLLNANCGHYTFTIPDVAPGNYLLRAEELALHTAGSPGGAQFYPGCFQLNVGGSGTAKPSTVKIPGVFSANDPGIQINIYQDLKSYAIPGPRPYGYSAPSPVAGAPKPTATWNTASQPKTVPTYVPAINDGPGGTTPAPTTSAGSNPNPVTTTTQRPPATTTQPSNGPAQTQWGQCGGIGWTGPTACVSPYTCKANSEYYHQCS
ncbi:endoglucanase II [Coprinopsis sp. MPI-PUGE-AT-0042]|nr:endoglucanase II [Coprinopsis sp. MPI-PUGE-AT-0042]